MSDTVIKVENLSKQYRIGSAVDRHQTFRETLTDTFTYPFRRLKHALNKGNAASDGNPEYIWALKDVSFEVKQGEVLGIIGRNGAGKSTLLKVLSRITEPTEGRATLRGRVGSLLEVGTGFHSELTGEENIYLSGTILGMKSNEISRKFDEIVAFSEVEKFINTPVKYYSSGMYMRLAFAVAAHLEPEILVVDEVLAVGDAEFQKKCLGKMDEVARQQGRTVLFVSHNMAAVQNLCRESVLLVYGTLEMAGPTQKVIGRYLETHKTDKMPLSAMTQRKGNGTLRFQKGVIKSTHLQEGMVETFSDATIELYYQLQNARSSASIRIDVGINNFLGTRVAWLSTHNLGQHIDLSAGKIVFTIKNFPLAPGDYNCNLFSQINNETADWLTNVLPFKVIEKDYYGTGKTVPPNQGDILLDYSISQ